MKKMSKKIISLMLSMALVAGGAVSAFASEDVEAETTGTEVSVEEETTESQEALDVIESLEDIEAIENADTEEELDAIEEESDSEDLDATEEETDSDESKTFERNKEDRKSFAERKERMLNVKTKMFRLKAEKLGLDVSDMTFQEIKDAMETFAMERLTSVAIKCGLDIEGLTKDEIRELIKAEKENLKDVKKAAKVFRHMDKTEKHLKNKQGKVKAEQ